MKQQKLRPSATTVHIVQQRRDSDCALCALCSVTGIPYLDALVEAARLDPDRVRHGLTRAHLKKVAAAFGITLKVKKKYDIDDATGILWVVCPDAKTDHAVVLKGGQIIDGDGTITDHDVYFANTAGVPGILLVATATGEKS
jgi:ABC-type bacteriocin/lantibiotic exporter with double-glycine peptidase domain